MQRNYVTSSFDYLRSISLLHKGMHYIFQYLLQTAGLLQNNDNGSDSIHIFVQQASYQ